ncbi:MAG: hypothetical protein ACJ72N_19750 [Labedaea sp.]
MRFYTRKVTFRCISALGVPRSGDVRPADCHHGDGRVHLAGLGAATG